MKVMPAAVWGSRNRCMEPIKRTMTAPLPNMHRTINSQLTNITVRVTEKYRVKPKCNTWATDKMFLRSLKVWITFLYWREWDREATFYSIATGLLIGLYEMNRDLSPDRFRTKIFLICDAFRLFQRGIVVIDRPVFCTTLIRITLEMEVKETWQMLSQQQIVLSSWRTHWNRYTMKSKATKKCDLLPEVVPEV